MPSCDFYVHDAQVPPKPSHDVKTKPTLLETYFFGGSSSTSRQQLIYLGIWTYLKEITPNRFNANALLPRCTNIGPAGVKVARTSRKLGGDRRDPRPEGLAYVGTPGQMCIGIKSIWSYLLQVSPFA
jgi:hypothetical protein